MKRLIEYTVFFGFVTAWRLATSPTRRSPLLVKATTEGVVRNPSAFAMTFGSPPSITATHELVVPRSMPMTLPMVVAVLSYAEMPLSERGLPRPARPSFRWMRRARARCTARPWCCVGSADVDRDLPRHRAGRLGQPDVEHAVLVRRLHLVGLDRRGQRERALEHARDAL